MQTLEELLQPQQKAFSLEELLPKRPQFSLEELQGKQAEILGKAQEKVKWIEEMKTPSKWTEEVWSTLGETLKETEGAQFFSKEFWTETGKTLVKQSLEAVREETIGRGARYLKTTPGLLTAQFITPKRLFPEKQIPSVAEMGVEAGRGAFGLLTFIPKTLFNLAKNPIQTIRDTPLDVLILIGATAGAKVARRAKAKSAKGWVKTGDFIDPIVESKMVSKQLKAKLLEVPSDIEFEIPTKPLEIIKTKKGGGQPFFRHWFEGIKKDIKNAGDLPDRPTKFSKLFGLRTAIRVFEVFPWMKRILYDEARIGKFNALMEENVFRKELKTWKKKLPRQSQERVGIYADYMQEGGAEIMKAMGKKFPELTPTEMQYYNWGQKTFRDFLPRLNQARGMAGEKPIGKVVNYSTWIRNLSELADMGIDITKAPVEMVEFHLNSIPLSMAKHRAPGILKAGVELNYGLLLENYARQSLNHIHMTPVIAKARTLLEPFKAQKWDMFKETPRLATWLQEWTDTIAGQKRMLPPGRAKMFTKVANTLNKNIAMAILSYNVRSALIQPTAIKLAYTLLGEKYTVQGLLKNLSPTARKFALENSKHLATRIFDIHAAEIMQSQLGKKFVRTKQAVAQWGMKPLQYLDFETARATWLGAYELATKKYGYKLKRAVTYADDIVTRTQASAQTFDIAPIQRTPGGRLLTLFQTFVINEYDMLTHDIFGYKNPYMNMAQRSRNISRFVVASAVVNAIYEGIFKLRSPYPAPEWELMRGIQEGDEPLKIAGGMVRETMEQLPIVGGTIRWSTPYRVAFPAVVQTGVVDPLTMLNRLLEKPSLTTDQLEWVGKILGIPGTSQVSKYVRRRKRGLSHIEAIVGIRTIGGTKKQPSW